MTFNLSQMKASTKALLVSIFTLAMTAQVPQVKDFLLPLVVNHPHLTSLAGALITILTILHNPQVATILQKFEQSLKSEQPDGTTTEEKTESTVTSTTKMGGVALIAILLMGTMAGCTKANGIKAAQDIVNWTPSLTSAVNTIDATASLILPADAVIFTAATAGFDAASALVVQYAKAYLANPSASILVNLQTAIMTLEQNTNQALLQVAGIKDANSQKLALAAISGVATIVTTILALVQSVSSVAQLHQMSEMSTVKLSSVRQYLDPVKVSEQAEHYNISPDRFFDTEAVMGF